VLILGVRQFSVPLERPTDCLICARLESQAFYLSRSPVPMTPVCLVIGFTEEELSLSVYSMVRNSVTGSSKLPLSNTRMISCYPFYSSLSSRSHNTGSDTTSGYISIKLNIVRISIYRLNDDIEVREYQRLPLLISRRNRREKLNAHSNLPLNFHGEHTSCRCIRNCGLVD